MTLVAGIQPMHPFYGWDPNYAGISRDPGTSACRVAPVMTTDCSSSSAPDDFLAATAKQPCPQDGSGMLGTTPPSVSLHDEFVDTPSNLSVVDQETLRPFDMLSSQESPPTPSETRFASTTKALPCQHETHMVSNHRSHTGTPVFRAGGNHRSFDAAAVDREL